MIKTLLTGLGFLSLCFNLIFAQAVYEPGSWPNSNWTVTGPYAPNSLTGNPTIHSNFKFNDDSAGPGSVDQPAAASPVIDLTPAHTSGEFTVEITADIVIGNFSGSDQISVDYYDATSTNWVPVTVLTAVQSGGSAGNAHNCTGMGSLPVTQIDITNFTAGQLTGFKYRFKYNDNASWEQGFCIKNPVLFSIATCPKPSNQTATGITQTTANLGWTENGTATTWDVELMTSGTSPSGTPTASGVSNPYNATGLSASTAYDFYVRADCGSGDLSTWEGPFTFTTQAPPCPDPSGLSAASITTTSAGLGWTENGTATTWDLEIILGGTTPSGTPTDAGITSNPFIANGLTPSTSYDFYVRADCGTGTSAWVGPYNFTTATACAVPSNLSASNMTNTSADLAWTENGTSTSWDIELIISGTTPSGTPTQAGVSSNPYSASGLTINTSYDFYVRAICGQGDTSVWEGPMTFQTTNNTCTDPSNQSANNISETTAELTWTENGSATIWDIELVSSGNSPTGSPNISGVTNPYTAGALSPNTAYDFYVRADCGNGSTSTFIGPYTFTTLATCLAPEDLAAFNETTSGADLNWTETGSATAWDLEILPTGTTPTGTPTNPAVAANPYTATGLNPATTYDYYVRAACGPNNSNWVGPISFTTLASACTDPSNLGASNIGDLEAELSWTENGTATQWDVEILISGTTPTGTPTSAAVTNPHVQTGLTPGTSYEFYVRADCATDVSSWVGPFGFNSTAGLNSEHSEIAVKLYPNPSKGVFTMELENEHAAIESAEIFDMNGRLILTINNIQSINMIDLTAQNKGVYTLKIVGAKGISTQRLIVQ